jgi:hypothetical protein
MARTPNPALTRDGVFLNAPRARRAISDHVRVGNLSDR